MCLIESDFDNMLGLHFGGSAPQCLINILGSAMISLFLNSNGEEWAELRRKFQKKMLAPMNVKPFYPLFSDVAVDAVEHLRSLRDENSIINDVCEEVVGRWALECKCFNTRFFIRK